MHLGSLFVRKRARKDLRQQPGWLRAGALQANTSPGGPFPHVNEKKSYFSIIIMKVSILISTALDYAYSPIVALAHEDSTFSPIAVD